MSVDKLHTTKDEFILAFNKATSVNHLCLLLNKSKPSVYTYACRFKVPLKNHFKIKDKLRIDGYFQYNNIKNHRRIVENVLKRKLKKGEVVHHINGNKTDNRNTNLLVCSTQYHTWLHNKMSNLYQQEHFKG